MESQARPDVRTIPKRDPGGSPPGTGFLLGILWALVLRIATLAGLGLALAALLALGDAGKAPRAPPKPQILALSRAPVELLPTALPARPTSKHAAPELVLGRTVLEVEPTGPVTQAGWRVQVHGWQELWSLERAAPGGAMQMRRCLVVELSVENVSGRTRPAFDVSLWNWLVWDREGISYVPRPCHAGERPLNRLLDGAGPDWEANWAAHHGLRGRLTFVVPSRAQGFVLQWGSAVIEPEQRWTLTRDPVGGWSSPARVQGASPPG